MLIGILETGRPPEELAARYRSYVFMFEQLLGEQNADFSFQTYAVLDGELPSAVDACDAWLVTGSKHGAYEDLPWIQQLKGFIQQAYQAQHPMLGICFGHQIIAAALGGEVEKSTKGWGMGLHEYWIEQPVLPSMQAGEYFSIYAMHQDQVVTRPPDARVVASSEFCEYAALAYGDTVFSFQGHPEFKCDFEHELITLRKGNAIPTAQADQALKDMAISPPPEGERVGQWLVEFVRRARAIKAT